MAVKIFMNANTVADCAHTEEFIAGTVAEKLLGAKSMTATTRPDSAPGTRKSFLLPCKGGNKHGH